MHLRFTLSNYFSTLVNFESMLIECNAFQLFLICLSSSKLFFTGVLPYGKCVQPMDIGLAVDSSAAVVPHWAQMQNFLKSLVDRFQMNGVSRIGLIQFDTIAKMPVRLDSYNDPIALKQHIMKLTPDPYGRRRTDAALDMAKEKLFSSARSGIPKMLLVVEHGKVNGMQFSKSFANQI